MKALVLSEHGDLDKLELVKDKPVPQPGDGEVLVRVGASSFNYHDILLYAACLESGFPCR